MLNSVKRHIKMTALFLACLLSLSFVNMSAVHAGVTIFPLKIIMEDRDRYAEVHVFNSGKEEFSYRLEWSFLRQRPDGLYETLEAPFESAFNLSKHIVYTPRRFTLKPGGRQTVRLSLRRPAGEIPAGEYRAHLAIQSYGGDKEKKPLRSPGDRGIVAAAKVYLGYSIPIIFRSGPYDAKVKIENVRFDPDPEIGAKRLLLSLIREGVHGTVGNLRAYHIVRGKDPVEVGLKNNINIFAENTRREANIQMIKTGLSGGQLHIVYNGEGSQKGQILAETYIPLN